MITGIRIEGVEATRASDEIITNMKFNINFDDVAVDGDTVKVKFTFITNYETGDLQNPKSVGQLKITGSLNSKEAKNDISEIKDVWGSKKTLPLGFAENVINLLNFECGSRGTLIAYSIGFVPPLPLSRAKLQDQS
jgi:hypothetical protein